jgi:hypothetical protein
VTSPTVRDAVRSGPLCGACPATIRTHGGSCTDCRLRAGSHLAGFPDARSALLTTRPRTWVLRLLLLCLGIGVVVPTVLIIIDGLVFSPQRTVTAFFGDLRRRDGDAAFGRLTLGPDDPAVATNTAMLRDAGYTPPSHLKVTDVDVDGGSALVSVTFDLAGTPASRTFRVRRDGLRSGVFSRWHIEANSGLPTNNAPDDGDIGRLYVVTPVETPVTIAGRTFTASAPVFGMAALPGAYKISVPANPLYRFEDTAHVPADTSESAHAPVLGPAATTTVQKAVDATLASCAKGTTSAPRNCPFSASYNCTSSRYRWQIVRSPAMQLEMTGGAEGPAGVVSTRVATGSSGLASYSGTCDGYPDSGSSEFTVDTALALSGGRLDVRVLPAEGSGD